MESSLSTSAGPTVAVPVMVAAELQDSLLTVLHDLNRLESLLGDATDNLLRSFGEANGALSDPQSANVQALVRARGALRSAVTELQFHDMATQLIAHTSKVVQSCAFRLAAEAMGEGKDDEPAAPLEAAPTRPNPVTQSEMAAGSVELF